MPSPADSRVRSSRRSLRLHELDPKPGDDAVHCIPDNLGVGMSDDDVALALVAGRGRLPYLRQPGLDDEMAELLLQLLDTVHRTDPATALPAQVGGARGVPALGPVEPAENDQLRPHLIEVHLVHVTEHRGDLGTRWSRGDLGDGDGAVRTAKPLHVSQCVPYAESLQSRGTNLPDRLVLRVVQLPRQDHGPLDP